jgi:L-lysine 6-transaminase
MFDEVQSGVGITGEFWAHQSLGVEPDLLAFGKKSQVCGLLAGRKLDEVEGHVFQTPSRINSTWGGNIVDMVRFDRILEIIEEDDLLGHAAEVGAHLLGEIEALTEEYEAVTGARGRGLMCAFDLPTPEARDRLTTLCFEEGAILLGCGVRTIRFRPPLTITQAQIDEGLAALRRALDRMDA